MGLDLVKEAPGDNLAPQIPMEPVSVVGWATTALAGAETQYPPEAAWLLI
jgi:hypothetical protein